MRGHRMMNAFSRRDFVRIGALGATAWSIPVKAARAVPTLQSKAQVSTIHLGLASYTFRNFDRAKLIAFMKQLNVSTLNAKDVKDHLPMNEQQETAALEDYKAAGVKLHAAGVISFAKDED